MIFIILVFVALGEICTGFKRLEKQKENFISSLFSKLWMNKMS